MSWDDDGNEQLGICPHCEFGLIFVEDSCSACGGKGEVWPFKDDPLKDLR